MARWRYLSTGDKRLDSLLDSSNKGFHYFPRHPIRVLIKGEPGTGKSVLSTQMALAFIKARESTRKTAQGALYYSLDEEIQKIERRINFLRGDRAVLTVAEKEFSQLEKGELEKTKVTTLVEKGGVAIRRKTPLFSEIPKLGKSLLQKGQEINVQSLVSLAPWGRIGILVEHIQEDVDLLQKKLHWRHLLIIVDSVNALFESTTEFVLRSTLRSLIEGLQTSTRQCCFAFVAEANGRSLTEDYLTDAVIFTEFDKSVGTRCLTVTKARDHEIRPAGHKVLIDNMGFRIVPQIVQLAPTDTSQTDESKRCCFEAMELDRLLTLPIQADKSAAEGTKQIWGLVQGSTTLLVGPAGTRKTLIGLQFLKAGLMRGRKERVDTVSFSPHKSGLWDIWDDFFRECPVPAGPLIFEVPALLEDVEDIILRHSIEAVQTPNRLVIGDLADFLLRFSEPHVRRMFARLQVLFRQKGITTIFILSTSLSVEPVARIGGKFSMIADNVISTSIVGEHKPQTKVTAICVRKFRGVHRSPQFVEYSYDPRTHELLLNREFLEDVIESKTGELSLGELRVYYFVGETDALNKFALYQRDLLMENYPGTPEECPSVVPFGQEDSISEEKLYPMGKRTIRRENLLQSLAFHPSFARRKRSEVLMFDQPWTKALERILIPLDDMLTGEEKLEFDSLPESVRKAFQTSEGNVLGLPYYHNFLALCYRSDILAGVQYERPLASMFKQRGIIRDNAIQTWHDLFRIADVAARKNHDPEANRFVVPFTYDDYNIECFAAMLISMTNERRKHPAFTEHIETIRRWLTCARDNKAVPSSALEVEILFPEQTRRGKKLGSHHVESVFSWCWYAQVLKLKSDYGLNNIHCLRSPLAVPVAGSWALGVLDGSLNPKRAMAIIRLLRSEQSQHRMTQLGAAIPPDQRKWAETWFPKNEQELFWQTTSRSEIDNYWNFRFNIAATMRELLEPIAKSLKQQGYDAPPARIYKIEDKLRILDSQLQKSQCL